ncbi:MAG TPA: ABC transporter permease subunit [Anaerolineales bacterium]|nr:ABC transporter permease subunit [Anaerolineales bacterium]
MTLRTHTASPDRFSGFNWPLLLGSVLVLFAVYLSVAGPGLAVHDPLKENFIVENPVTREFVKPPFPAFTLPDFPLGSDQYGRDLLSQLLWAVRPTLTMVLLVAALRLVVGTVVGLASGWWAGRWGRALDALISGALAAPVLFVALCLIAAVGIEWGVWAFILGLSATGWAEAARLVREQTRSAKSQPYVETARSLGASDSQILVRHILPQIMPLLWVLLSFEVSSTLLAAAGLGFLGYFINSIWIPLGDWSGIRASGKPELGQMLATASQNAQAQPWGMLAAGTMVFIMVLGFNLLGEGLRRQLAPRRQRETLLTQIASDVAGVLEDRWFDPLSPWRRNLAYSLATVTLLVLILGGGVTLWQAEAVKLADTVVSVPGSHLWASEQHDAQGTLWVEVPGPARAEVAWTFADEAGFSGGPVVAADGTLYVAANSRKLYALSPDGATRWEAELPATPAGSPAVTVDGDIVVLDGEGKVSDFTPEGEARWTVQPEKGVAPLASPIIDEAGTIYYATELSLIAVSLDGAVKWKRPLPTYSYASPLPRLSAAGEYVFFDDVALNAKTGEAVFEATAEPLDKYIVGTDGSTYLHQQTALLKVKTTEQGAEISPQARWDPRPLVGLGFRFPRDAGVTPDGRIWVYYASEFEFAKLLWLDRDGEPLASIDYPYRPARLMALDQDATAYMCGMYSDGPGAGGRGGALQCRAHRPGPGAPVWELTLEKGALPSGGALVPGRLYVTTRDGWLYAIGAGNAAQ